MIAPFRNHLPVKIRFGDGVASQLGAVLEEESGERPFLIMDSGLDQFVPGDRQPAFLATSQLRPLLSVAGQRGITSLPPDAVAVIDRLKKDRRI